MVRTYPVTGEIEFVVTETFELDYTLISCGDYKIILQITVLPQCVVNEYVQTPNVYITL